MAKKDLTGNCLTTAGAKYNYESEPGRIRFLNYDSKCQEFLKEGDQLKEKKSTDNTAANLPISGTPITSDKLTVNSFQLNLSGQAQPPTDYLQPRVTIFLEILGRETGVGQPKIQIQTSVSQRDLDIQY